MGAYPIRIVQKLALFPWCNSSRLQQSCNHLDHLNPVDRLSDKVIHAGFQAASTVRPSRSCRRRGNGNFRIERRRVVDLGDVRAFRYHMR